ncbi:hypothetical protein K491DRAFT_503075 [Lophiostoma macrostomum CBS 122681]|uniref:Uncharacterized protein n=1 Tax=Lophiostoma macrostomum CBS 122681 TaxID=1314788 RepID=A0A6A6T4I8_9PLEO|nr:hypothetical protein K491DRAFT_503075 [Lophiostoma macrostomum CBS 122681]
MTLSSTMDLLFTTKEISAFPLHLMTSLVSSAVPDTPLGGLSQVPLHCAVGTRCQIQHFPPLNSQLFASACWKHSSRDSTNGLGVRNDHNLKWLSSVTWCIQTFLVKTEELAVVVNRLQVRRCATGPEAVCRSITELQLGTLYPSSASAAQRHYYTSPRSYRIRLGMGKCCCVVRPWWDLGGCSDWPVSR